METIESIFENYKESRNEEIPYTKEQHDKFDAFSYIIDKVFAESDKEEYKKTTTCI